MKQILLASLVGAGVVMSTSAQAIPDNQENCVIGFANAPTSTAPEAFKPIVGSAVSINNGTTTQKVVVHFSADACVDSNAEIRLAYSVDNGPPTTFGPANLANHQEFCETRDTLAVIPLGPGFHTIRPFFRVNGPNGRIGVVGTRCTTVEGFTR
jgi:hypothetical protein